MVDSVKRKYLGLWLYIKASVASQIASWVDLGTAFVLFSWVNMNAAYSTAIGAFAGGVINCYINYKWTFKVEGMPMSHVAFKYALVWIGSLTLNTFGTAYVNDLLQGWDWLSTFHMDEDARFAVARLGVSLIVSIFWNFMLQRYFVYRPVNIKGYIKNRVPRHHSKSTDDSAAITELVEELGAEESERGKTIKQQ